MELIRVLVVDDEEATLLALQNVLCDPRIVFTPFEDVSATKVINWLEKNTVGSEPQPLVAIVDLAKGLTTTGNFEQDYKGMEILDAVHEEYGDRLPVIMLTQSNDNHDRLAAMNRGAVDLFWKDDVFIKDNAGELKTRILEAAEKAEGCRSAKLPQDPKKFGKLIYCSAAMQDMVERAKILAKHDINILLLGDTGAGKELVAHAIHLESRYSSAKWIPLNLGGLANYGNVMETELFGHAHDWPQGTPCDAHLGLFMRASGWEFAAKQGKKTLIPDVGVVKKDEPTTLFLDEVGDAAPTIQAALLRAIQEKKVVPLGIDSKEFDVGGFRLITATRLPLDEWVEGDDANLRGRFREDLYYRIAGAIIRIPTLAERGEEEIRLLASHFCQQHRKKHFPTEDAALSFSEADMSLLCHYQWPGNARELEQFVQEAVVFAGQDCKHIIPLTSHLHQRLSDRIDSLRWQQKRNKN